MLPTFFKGSLGDSTMIFTMPSIHTKITRITVKREVGTIAGFFSFSFCYCFLVLFNRNRSGMIRSKTS